MPPDSLLLELTDPASQLGNIRHAVTEFGRQHDLAAALVFEATLAIEEVVTNAASHGGTDEGALRITISLRLETTDLRIHVTDSGRPFNPLVVPSPNTELPLVDRPVGGLGVHLVRSLMDDVVYRREDGKNILAMRKRR
jgi:serine/threonine-protein kinase RsbW